MNINTWMKLGQQQLIKSDLLCSMYLSHHSIDVFTFCQLNTISAEEKMPTGSKRSCYLPTKKRYRKTEAQNWEGVLDFLYFRVFTHPLP